LADDSGRRKNVRIKAKLKVRFKDVSAFIAEYTHNISKGGLFVRTGKPCELGSFVQVIIILPEGDKEVPALGEVIHVVSADQATSAQPAGMGIELKEITPEDQQMIEKFIEDKLKQDQYADGLGRREHRRYEARIRVRFGSLEALIEEYTHNISHGGIFIRTRNPKKLNERVKVILAHPQSGEEMIMDGEVVRVVSDHESQVTGQPPGMGVRFLTMDKYTRDQLSAFINANCFPKDAQVSVEEG
jgi:type IV pilus assembly protein PilZ